MVLYRGCERLSYEESKKIFLHLQTSLIYFVVMQVFWQKTGFEQKKFEKFDLTFQAIMISGKNGYLRKKNIRP